METFVDSASTMAGVFALSEFSAAYSQPVIEFDQIRKARKRRE
ncbi:hypothetical protein EBME_2127 [bacterium endosymbiont of Mortierella elongata FMR23-6]|nr:hypothetical protein EBME_2127 [bacterium endosymbiont of Mortierella elongata FMR23-6]